MAQYRCVPAPTNIEISSKQGMSRAMSQFEDIINGEVQNGWKFYSMENVAVTQKAGCLAGLFGGGDVTVQVNMLIFVKD